jgi:hypothetical protein
MPSPARLAALAPVSLTVLVQEMVDVSGVTFNSIVAREYGIPAVLGTGVATRRITDGARVLVNGDVGTVTLLDEPRTRRPHHRSPAAAGAPGHEWSAHPSPARWPWESPPGGSDVAQADPGSTARPPLRCSAPRRLSYTGVKIVGVRLVWPVVHIGKVFAEELIPTATVINSPWRLSPCKLRYHRAGTQSHNVPPLRT